MTDRDRAAAAFSSLFDVPSRLADLEAKLDHALAALAKIAQVLPPPVVTVREATRLLDVSVPTVRRLVKRGDIKAVKVGGSVRIDLGSVQPVNDAEIAELAERARVTGGGGSR